MGGGRLRVCVCAYLYACVRAGICMRVCMCVRLCVRVYDVCACMYLCARVQLCACVCVCVCDACVGGCTRARARAAPLNLALISLRISPVL